MPLNEKDYIGVRVYWDTDGEVMPTVLYLEGGGVYEVDRILNICPHASRKFGGFGLRYTVRTSCEDEEVYNKLFYVYLERFGKVGRWRCEEDYLDMEADWDKVGQISPLVMYPGDSESAYRISRVVQAYPMSTRKTDGSGMRYIVQASCEQHRVCNRGYSLMLEEGGSFVGRWFCEDAQGLASLQR